MARKSSSSPASADAVVAGRRNRTFGKRRPEIKEVAPGVFRFRVVLGLNVRGEPVRRLHTVRGTRKDAERKLDEVLKGVRDGQTFAATGEKVGPWIARWIDTAEGTKAPATLAGYRKLAALLPPWFNALPLSDVTPPSVERLLAELAASRRRVLLAPDGSAWTASHQHDYEKALRQYERAQVPLASPRAQRRKTQRLAEQGTPTRPEGPREVEGPPRGTRTVTAVRTMVRAAFATAVRRQLMAKNPASGEFIEAPTHTAKRRRVMSRLEATALWSAAVQHERGAYVLLLMSTGLRPSEALALRWSDTSDDVLVIDGALTQKRGGGWERKAPKTAAGVRQLAIDDPDVRAALERERRLYDAMRATAAATLEPWCDDGFVFSTQRGTPYDVRGADRRLFRPVVAAAIAALFPDEAARPTGVDAPFADVSLYSLRHTTATALMRSNTPLAVVAQLLGHADPKFTARQYQHATIDDSRAALTNAVRLFKAAEEPVTPPPTQPSTAGKVLPFASPKRMAAR